MTPVLGCAQRARPVCARARSKIWQRARAQLALRAGSVGALAPHGRARRGWVHEAVLEDIDRPRSVTRCTRRAAGDDRGRAARFRRRGAAPERLYFDSFDYAPDTLDAPAHERRHQILIFGRLRLQQRRRQPAFAQPGGDARARNQPVRALELARAMPASPARANCAADLKLVAVITCTSPAANLSRIAASVAALGVAGTLRRHRPCITCAPRRVSSCSSNCRPLLPLMMQICGGPPGCSKPRMQQQTLGVEVRASAEPPLGSPPDSGRAPSPDPCAARGRSRRLVEQRRAESTALALVKMMRSKPSSAPDCAANARRSPKGLISTAGKRKRARALRFQQSAQRHRLLFGSSDQDADTVQRQHAARPVRKRSSTMSGAGGQHTLGQPPPQRRRIFGAPGKRVAQQPRTIGLGHESFEGHFDPRSSSCVAGDRRLTAAAEALVQMPAPRP